MTRVSHPQAIPPVSVTRFCLRSSAIATAAAFAICTLATAAWAADDWADWGSAPDGNGAVTPAEHCLSDTVTEITLPGTSAKVYVQDIAENWLNSDTHTKAFNEAAKKFFTKLDDIDAKLFALDPTARATFKSDYSTKIWDVYKIAAKAARANSKPCSQCQMLDDLGYLANLTTEDDPFQIRRIRTAINQKAATDSGKSASTASPGTSKIKKSRAKLIHSNGSDEVELKSVSQNGIKGVRALVQRLQTITPALSTVSNTFAQAIVAAGCAPPANTTTGRTSDEKKACSALIANKCRNEKGGVSDYANASTYCTQPLLLSDIEKTWDDIVTSLKGNTTSTATDQVMNFSTWADKAIKSKLPCDTATTFKNIGGKRLVY